MKRILLTTTSLILAAGVAHSEVTFSGKGELGFNRSAKSAAVAQVVGVQTQVGTANASTAMSTSTDGNYDAATDGTAAIDASGNVAVTAATGTAAAATAATIAAAKAEVERAKQALATAEAAVKAAVGIAAHDLAVDAVAGAKRDVALAEASLAAQEPTAAKAAVKEGDFVAYSGYDLNVAVSGATDNGTTFSMGFDMGAGQIADRDDDRAMDTMGTTIAASALTIGYNGVTYVVGQNEIDDLYDDSQNGDVSVAGSMGGISYTLVADLDKDTKAAKAKYTASNDGAARTVASTTALGAAAGTGATINDGDADYKNATWTDAVAAVHESTSLKLSGAAGALGWSLTSTNKNDTGDAASAVNLSYAAGDAFTLAVNHDTKGKAAAITKLTATYVMDALTLSLSTANDKNHAGNTNTSSKASQNLSLAYAAGPMKATFATDESSAWSVVTQYDLGGGAQAFATVDHTEFAVLGLSFAF